MTPQQKIKWLVILKLADWDKKEPPVVTEENVEDLYGDIVARGEHWEALSEIREGECETGVEYEWSRHYESKPVASRMPDGSWVGWTYWYGGGKHGDPEAIDWMSDAYDLDVTEEEKMVTVRTFTKKKVR